MLLEELIQNHINKTIQQSVRRRLGFSDCDVYLSTLTSQHACQFLSGSSTVFGSNLVLTDEDRSAHTHIIGTTQYGKSKFMENLIRQDIDRGRGLVLIDPKGSLFLDVLRYCALHDVQKVCIFDPANTYNLGNGWERLYTSFNPLQGPAYYQSGRVLESIISAWRQDWDQLPRLSKYLRAILEVLSLSKLTLLEALHFLHLQDQIRGQILDRFINPPPAAKVIRDLYTLSKHDLMTLLDSTASRLEFMFNPILQRFLGAGENSVRIDKMIAADWVILVNLNPGWAGNRKFPTILGNLILTEVLNSTPSQLYSIYVDEVGYFATPTLKQMLELKLQSRFVIHVAHHFLEQLAGISGFKDSILQACGNKVVFRCPDYREASVMSKLVNVEPSTLQYLPRATALASVQGESQLIEVPFIEPVDNPVDGYIKSLYDKYVFYRTKNQVIHAIMRRQSALVPSPKKKATIKKVKIDWNARTIREDLAEN